MWEKPRSGGKDMKLSQQYPRNFGEQVAEYHMQYKGSETWSKHVYLCMWGWIHFNSRICLVLYT